VKGRIGIIGGGIAGLSTAYYLMKRGFEPTVFESETSLGGLAGMIELEPSVFIERFYHFICKPDGHLLELVKELDLAHQLRWHETKMSLFHNGQLHPFGSPFDLLNFSPLSMGQRLRVGIHVIKSRQLKNWHVLDGRTAVDWLKDELGEEAYRVIWEPLLKMKFGPRHTEVSAAWIWSRIARVAKSRVGVRQVERLGYLVGGTGSLLRRLAERLEGRIRLNATIRKIRIEDGRVRGLDVSGRFEPFDGVVSTVPLKLLAELAPEISENYRKQLLQIEYLGVTCLLLKLRHSFSPYFWTNISDQSIPFAGMIEFSRLNPLPELKGQSVLYIPHYLSASEERFGWDLNKTVQQYLPALKRINPSFREADIVSAVLSKAAFAQVVCQVGFSALIPPFHAPVEGLFLTDSTQLYPEDRVISDLIGCGKQVAELICATH